MTSQRMLIRHAAMCLPSRVGSLVIDFLFTGNRGTVRRLLHAMGSKFRTSCFAGFCAENESLLAVSDRGHSSD